MHSDGGLIAGGLGLALRDATGARRRRLDRVPVHPHRRARLPRGDARLRHARGPARDVRSAQRGRDVLASRRHDGGRQHRVLPRVPQRAAQGPVEAGDPVAAAPQRWRRAETARGVPRGPRRDAHPDLPRLRDDRVPDDHPGLDRPTTTSSSPNTDGAPVFGCEVQVVGDDGKPVPAGVTGEVRVRGPMVAKGYTDPELSAASFGADGFFTTGDRGYLRDDGHLVLTGRTKELIIRKGENISPREIEDLLQTHPKVAAVAVIGLPDRERGRARVRGGRDRRRHAVDVRRDAAVLPRRRTDGAEDPRAARGRRRVAAERHVQDPEARTGQAVHGGNRR